MHNARWLQCRVAPSKGVPAQHAWPKLSYAGPVCRVLTIPFITPLQVYSKEPGNISPRMAEMRADLGSAATDLSQFQAFDGPIPETVNGRLAMLGVVAGEGVLNSLIMVERLFHQMFMMIRLQPAKLQLSCLSYQTLFEAVCLIRRFPKLSVLSDVLKQNIANGLRSSTRWSD